MADMVHPPIGDKVRCHYFANTYTAVVVSHGKKYSTIEFKLKNGRQLTRTAEIYPKGTLSSNRISESRIFATYDPGSFGNTEGAKLFSAPGEHP